MNRPATQISELELYRVSNAVPPVDVEPDVGELGRLVMLLDSDNYDQLFIETGDRETGRIRLVLSGGANGEAVLFIAVDSGDTFYVRKHDDESFEYATVSSGGAGVDVLSRWLVPVDQAARGLYYYLLTGHLDPALRWDRLSEIDFRPE